MISLLALLIEPVVRPQVPPLVRQFTFRGVRRLLQMAGYPCCCADESSSSSSQTVSTSSNTVSSSSSSSASFNCQFCDTNTAPSTAIVVISGFSAGDCSLGCGDCTVFNGTWVINPIFPQGGPTGPCIGNFVNAFADEFGDALCCVGSGCSAADCGDLNIARVAKGATSTWRVVVGVASNCYRYEGSADDENCLTARTLSNVHALGNCLFSGTKQCTYPSTVSVSFAP